MSLATDDEVVKQVNKGLSSTGTRQTGSLGVNHSQDYVQRSSLCSSSSSSTYRNTDSTISGRSDAATAGSTHVEWPPFSQMERDTSLPSWCKPTKEESSEESEDEAEEEVKKTKEIDQGVDDTLVPIPESILDLTEEGSERKVSLSSVRSATTPLTQITAVGRRKCRQAEMTAGWACHTLS